MPGVLVIDDDAAVHRLVEKTFEDSDLAVHTAPSGDEGLGVLKRHIPEVVLLDVLLPNMTGLEVVKKIREHDAKLPVIFVTVVGESETAIEAMKLGAYDYLLKPLDVQNLRELVLRARDNGRMMQVPVTLPGSEGADEEADRLIGRCPQMLQVYKDVGRIAAQDVPVLICGESGTGKELIARALYQHSDRKECCFLVVNCAALLDTLLESELFGHEKGAFTGAEHQRIGKFEQCNGGTILLDEIGDMSPVVQGKVLRLLQEQKFERVGGSETVETDVRIISATNRDLDAMIDQGEFRLDLYHRLNGFKIVLPPLRERGDDLELLLDHFLKVFRDEFNKDIDGISPEALALLRRYSWPGNVRELQGVLQKAILRSTGPVLVPDFLPAEVRGEADPASVLDPEVASCGLPAFVDQRQREGSNELYAETLEFMERFLLAKVLRETNGNQSQAARRLGITRGSLRNKMAALRISVDQTIKAS